MNNNNNNTGVWDWQGPDNTFEDTTGIDISKCMLNGGNQNESHLSYIFDDKTTPVKACGDLAYQVNNNAYLHSKRPAEVEPFSQVKRRRMLQFEHEVLDAPICHDEEFLRSKETPESLEDAISEMSQWVAGYSEIPPVSNNEFIDPASDGWIAECFNDAEMQFNTDFVASGASDVQVDISDFCNTPPEYNANAVVLGKPPVHTRKNVSFKGKKSYMRSPPKQASSIVYPFTFIKPCNAHGDVVTLKDINRKILNPPKPKENEQNYPTSAFSGKPVVGKTKIRTEGGEGSITIVRTQG